MNELQQIRTLLEALLDDQLHWVHGYAHGRTEANDDPYIILYGPDPLQHKITACYEHQFRHLPEYVDTDVAADAGTYRAKPDKQAAQRMGIYHACRPFQIVTKYGRETQMGREVRFFRTYRLGLELAPPLPTPPPIRTKNAPEILYLDGVAVDTDNEAEVAAYHDYLREKRGPAASRKALRAWVKAQREVTA